MIDSYTLENKEEKTMTANDYRKTMIDLVKYLRDEYANKNTNSEYVEGIVRGLEIALSKLHKSAFLTEEE